MHDYKTILTIAGSDSIGGAGILADIRTSAAIGVYAMAAVTAVTAQNSVGVAGYDAVSAEMLRLQLETVACDVMPDAVKTGMVPTAGQALVIADFMARLHPGNLVVDPVMVSTSGEMLGASEVMGVMMEKVMPLATLVTPNLPEMERLTGLPVISRGERERSCNRLIENTGCRAVLLKGGHGEDPGRLVDILAMREGGSVRFVEFSHPRIATHNTHGTGCTLSSAIASFLALGEDLEEAVRKGISFLQRALTSGQGRRFGQSGGHGPAFFMERVCVRPGEVTCDESQMIME